ncbi:Ankyrin repeat domain-containing protein [Balamuthia mandrillaris]
MSAGGSAGGKRKHTHEERCNDGKAPAEGTKTKKQRTRGHPARLRSTAASKDAATCWIEALLPEELLCHILQFLPDSWVAAAARTCRRWYSCAPAHLRQTVEAEAVCSSLAMLQWAVANGCPLKEEICAEAAFQGQLEALQWARKQQQGRPCWGERACSCAASGGHLAVLQWLRAQGCPWDHRVDICPSAAENGRLEVLKWAREQGMPLE